jgi:uncharacterized delta-60 repeat protein
LALQPDGKIVVAGFSDASASGDFDFALARYLPNGTLDMTFSGDGKVLTDFGSGSDYAQALVLQPNSKIVVAGQSAASGNQDIALARYLPNGTLDATFSGDGKVLTPFGSGSSDVASALAIQPRDGRLVVAGASDAHGTVAFALARYHAITCNGVVATLIGTAGNDTLMGTAGPDVIVGFDGDDTIYGLGGNDLLVEEECGEPPGTQPLDHRKGGEAVWKGSWLARPRSRYWSGLGRCWKPPYTGGVGHDRSGSVLDQRVKRLA